MITIHSEVQALIFDCDGTLADTMPMHDQAWHDAFAGVNLVCPQSFLDKLRGVPALQMVVLFNEEYGHALDVEQFAAAKQRLFQQNITQIKPLAPIVAIVEQYRQRLPMAVASGGTRENVHRILDAIGYRHCFDEILTSDDPVAPKPEPGLFLEAARRLGVEPAFCQVFEDGEPGLEAARRAGMIATDVRPFV